MIDKHLDPALAVELDLARECFYEALEGNTQLPLLLLVDPIRALEDAGARLSGRARQYIRRAYPGRSYGNREIYSAVQDGKIQLPRLRAVRVRREVTEQEDLSSSLKGV